MKSFLLIVLLSSPALGQSIVLRNTLPDKITLWVLQKPPPAPLNEWFSAYVGRNATVSLSLEPPGNYYVTFIEGTREIPLGWYDFHRLYQRDPNAEVSLRAMYSYTVATYADQYIRVWRNGRWVWQRVPPPPPKPPVRTGQALVVQSKGKTYYFNDFVGKTPN